MGLDRDSIAYLNFHLPRQYPELFETLHHAVQVHLDALKVAGTLPDDIDLYRLVLNFDVRPRREIAEREKQFHALYAHLQRIAEGASSEATIEY
jgi:hypothetical protein